MKLNVVPMPVSISSPKPSTASTGIDTLVTVMKPPGASQPATALYASSKIVSRRAMSSTDSKPGEPSNSSKSETSKGTTFAVQIGSVGVREGVTDGTLLSTSDGGLLGECVEVSELAGFEGDFVSPFGLDLNMALPLPLNDSEGERELFFFTVDIAYDLGEVSYFKYSPPLPLEEALWLMFVLALLFIDVSNRRRRSCWETPPWLTWSRRPHTGFTHDKLYKQTVQKRGGRKTILMVSRKTKRNSLVPREARCSDFSRNRGRVHLGEGICSNHFPTSTVRLKSLASKIDRYHRHYRCKNEVLVSRI